MQQAAENQSTKGDHGDLCRIRTDIYQHHAGRFIDIQTEPYSICDRFSHT